MADATTAPARSRRTPAPTDSQPDTSAVKAAETLAVNVRAAEAAQERLAAAVAAAEALLAKLPEEANAAWSARDAALAEASERVAAQVRDMQAAAARAVEQAGATVASGVKAAETTMGKAAEAAAAQLAQNLKAAETAADRFGSRMAEALAAAEEGFGKLVAQAEADREAAAQASRQLMAWPQTGAVTTEATGVLVDGMVRTRQEVSDFVAGRIRQGIEAQAELMGCRSLADVRAVQSRFMRTAVEQYAAEAGSLAEIGRDMIARVPRAARG